MEAVSILAGKVAELIIESLMKSCCNEIDYVKHYRESINSLEQELEKLGGLRIEVEVKVQRARDGGQIVNDNVQNWLTSVDDMKIEVEEFLKDKVGENKGWCTPGVCSKYRLGKEAKKKTKSVLGLKEDGTTFTEFCHPPPPPTFESRSFNDYDHFDSRKDVFREIMQALKDDNIKMIGVYGMGGVGKTAMVDEVGKQAEKDLLFDKVVKITISQTFNLRNVQGELAYQLGQKLDEETDLGRAGQLCNILKNGKRTLVIIDDIWKKIKLKEIGIPLIDGVTGCKIVLTTRKQDVCDQMKVQIKFLIGVLSEHEAWALFKTKVGDSKISSPEMRAIAEDVCRECGRLPLALLIFGGVLMKSEMYVWKDVLEQLKTSRLNNVQGWEEEVYSKLELSYKYLEQIDEKSCFLLCCLFPEDAEISIEDLVAYAMGMRRFGDFRTIENARNRVKTLVDNLKTSCLLLEGRDRDLVKMHDVVRDVAISIASKNEQAYLVKTGIKEWREMDTYKHYTAIFLWSMEIKKLPNSLECPNLQVLVLEFRNDHYKIKIPSSFFNGMDKLEVLVLENMSISPESSIIHLINLRMLCLNFCNLVDISFLKELKKLENLSLKRSNIKKFEPEIGELTCLRRLDLRTDINLGMIPTHVISSLSCLEELYIDNLPAYSKVELEATDKERCNTSLSIAFPKDTVFEKLTSFNVIIGNRIDVMHDVYIRTSPRALYLCGNPLEHWVQVLLLKANALRLRRLHDLNKVFHDRDRMGVSDLKYLNIDGCSVSELSASAISECGLKHLIVSSSIARGILKLEHLEIENCVSMDRIIGNEADENEEEAAVGLATFHQLRCIKFLRLPNLISFYPKMKYMSTPEQNQSIPVQPLFNEKVAFPALEELTINGLNMKDIWDKKLPEDSFCHLKLLEVKGCHNMVSLIPFHMLLRLQNLEGITISKCDQMTCELEWLNDEEKNETKNIELPNVKRIHLKGLPNLTQTGLNSGITYMNLRTLDIDGCVSLRYVFSASTARSLVHLKELSVGSCEKMEEIVTIEEEGPEKMNKIVFHQLEILKLLKLPTLECFCSFGFEEVGVVAGQSVPQRPLFSDRVAFPALKKLTISGLKMKDIWDKKLPKDSFCHLNLLEVKGCHNMVSLIPFHMLQRLQNLEGITISTCGSFGNVFSASTARSLVHLKKLSVDSCEKMKEIVIIEEEGPEKMNKIIFHQLEILNLADLPTLECFCSSGFKEVGVVTGENFPQRALFSDEVAFPALEKLTINGLNFKDIWDKKLPKDSFCHLKLLDVKSCHNMKEIVTVEEEEAEKMNKIVFHKLEILNLSDLPTLECFCSSGFKEVDVVAGKNVPQRALFSNEVAFPRLRYLNIRNFSNLTEIWQSTVPVDSFCSLFMLDIYNCDKLVDVDSSKLRARFPTLKRCVINPRNQ